MNNFTGAIAALIAAAFGLAIIAVLVSKNANTSGVITGFGSALGSIIGAAVAPVSQSGNTSNAGISSVPGYANLFSSNAIG